MAGITLVIAEAKLQLWLDAEGKVANGQAWSFEGRQMTRANLNEIRDQIIFWESKIEKLSPRQKIRRITNIT